MERMVRKFGCTLSLVAFPRVTSRLWMAIAAMAKAFCLSLRLRHRQSGSPRLRHHRSGSLRPPPRPTRAPPPVPTGAPPPETRTGGSSGSGSRDPWEPSVRGTREKRNPVFINLINDDSEGEGGFRAADAEGPTPPNNMWIGTIRPLAIGILRRRTRRRETGTTTA